MVRGAPSCARALAATAVLALVATTAQQPVRAQGEDTGRMASEAYERGATAYDAGDYATAARELARADALVPNAVALELALRSAARADDAPFAMLLVERAEQRQGTGTLAQTATETRNAFVTRVAVLQVHCPARRACRASMDGEPIAIGVRRWVKPGDHAIELTVDNKLESRHVRVEPQQELSVESAVAPAPEPVFPPIAPAVQPEPDGGLSPWWFWGGVALTAVAGGVLIWSAVDTKNKYDTFQQAEPPTLAMQEDGEAAKLRTNIFVGITSALGVATAAFGIFAVRWSDAPASADESVAMALSPTSIQLTAHFR